MRKLIAILFVGIASMSFGQEINLDVSNATVDFNYVSEKTLGTLDGVTAKVVINPSDMSASKIVGSVQVSTLSTGNKSRDKHLMSADFFDAEKYPTMSFESGAMTKTDDGYEAKGNLTIRDVTKEVVFTVTEVEGVLKFKTSILSSEFGVSTKGDGDKSKVIVLVKVPLG